MDTTFKEDNDQYLEFLAAVKHLVEKINTGEITLKMRMRGPRAQLVQNEFAEARQKAVHLIKTFRMVAKEKFRAIEYDEWVNRPENAGKDPAKEHVVREVPIMNRGMVKCVIVRLGPKGEYDLDFESALGVRMTEELSGADALNAVQADNRFDAALNTSVGAVAASLTDAVTVPVAQVTSNADNTSSVQIEEVTEGVEEEVDEYEEVAEPANAMVGSIFSCLSSSLPPVTKASAKAGAKASTKAGAKASAKASATAKASAKANPQAACQAELIVASAASTQSVAKASLTTPSAPSLRNKAMPPEPPQELGKEWEQLPEDERKECINTAEHYLTDETEFREAQPIAAEIQKAFRAPPFNGLAMDMSTKKQLVGTTKTLIPQLVDAYKAFAKLFTKLSKRARVPPEVVQYVVRYRSALKLGQLLMSLVCQKSPDIEDFKVAVETFQDFFDIPLAICAKYHVCFILESLQFGDVSELQESLGQKQILNVSFSQKQLQQVHHEAIELGLAKLATKVKSVNDTEAIDSLQMVANTVFDCQDSVNDDDQSDLMLLAKALLFDPSSHSQTELTAWQSLNGVHTQLKEMAKCAEYAGVLKSLLYSSSWKTIEKVIDATLKKFAKLDGSTHFLTQIAAMIATYADPATPLVPTDSAEWERLCAKVAGSLKMNEANVQDVLAVGNLVTSEAQVVARGKTKALEQVRLAAVDTLAGAEDVHDTKATLSRVKSRLRLSTTFARLFVPVKRHLDQSSEEALHQIGKDVKHVDTLGDVLNLLFKISAGFATSSTEENLKRHHNLNSGIIDSLDCLDDATRNALDNFKARFNLSDAATDAYAKAKTKQANYMVDVIHFLVDGIPLPTPVKVFKSEFKVATTHMKQLVQYSSHPKDDKENIQYGDYMYDVAMADGIIDKLKEAQAGYDQCIAYLTMNGNAFRAFRTAVAGLLALPQDVAVSRWKWLVDNSAEVNLLQLHARVVRDYQTAIDNFLSSVQGLVQSHIDEVGLDNLKKKLAQFANDLKSDKLAADAKAACDKLNVVYAEASTALKDLVEVKVLDEDKEQPVPLPLANLKTVLLQYDDLTVRWGMTKLCESSETRRAKEGKSARASIRKIIQNFPRAFQKLEEPLKTQARELIEIDGEALEEAKAVGAAAPTADQQSTREPAPKRPRKKSAVVAAASPPQPRQGEGGQTCETDPAVALQDLQVEPDGQCLEPAVDLQDLQDLQVEPAEQSLEPAVDLQDVHETEGKGPDKASAVDEANVRVPTEETAQTPPPKRQRGEKKAQTSPPVRKRPSMATRPDLLLEAEAEAD